jgi:hypothetical protein
MDEKSTPSASDSGAGGTVTLRDDRTGPTWYRLWAYVDEGGNLHINGQDLGPGTSMVSPDGEYEYFETYAPQVIPRIVEVLDGQPGEPVLEVLRRWAGDRSQQMQMRLNGIPHRTYTC